MRGAIFIAEAELGNTAARCGDCQLSLSFATVAGERRTYATTFFRREEWVCWNSARANRVVPEFMAPVADALEAARARAGA